MAAGDRARLRIARRTAQHGPGADLPVRSALARQAVRGDVRCGRFRSASCGRCALQAQAVGLCPPSNPMLAPADAEHLFHAVRQADHRHCPAPHAEPAMAQQVGADARPVPERCGRWASSRKLARGASFYSKSDRRARQPNVDHGRVDTGHRTLRAVAAFPRTSRRPRPAGTPQQDGDRSTRQPSHAWRACHLRAQICSEGAQGARHSLDMHALRFRCYINCRAVGAMTASAAQV